MEYVFWILELVSPYRKGRRMLLQNQLLQKIKTIVSTLKKPNLCRLVI
jgi:hypothetical protein